MSKRIRQRPSHNGIHRFLNKSLVLVLFLAIVQIGFSEVSQSKLDSLKKELSQTKKDSTKISILLQLSNALLEGSHQEAFDYAQKAYLLAKSTGHAKGILHALLIKGMIYSSFRQDYESAYKCHLEALKLAEKVKDTLVQASCYNSMAYGYKVQQQYGKARVALQHALSMYQSLYDRNRSVAMYQQLSELYEIEGKPDSALLLSKLCLEMADSITIPDLKARTYMQYAMLLMNNHKIDDAIKNSRIAISIFQSEQSHRNVAFTMLLIAMQYQQIKSYKLALMTADSALALCLKHGLRKEELDAYQALESIYSDKGDYKMSYSYLKKYTALKDSVSIKSSTIKIANLESENAYEIKEAIAKSEQEKKDTLQRTIRNSIVAALIGSLIFLLVVYRQRNKIAIAQKKSDDLLLNILPEEVAEELKNKGSADAKQFNEVTVMFTDFKDFTKISENLNPAELVSEIHFCFKAFDEIITAHNIEKIKTIGDSYMCVGGLPISNTTHAIDIIHAALEIQEFITQHKKEREREGKKAFEIRIGIHTGNVVAGIVGVKKFAYDIWGDTVNIASRMESSGEAGKINISGSTYALIKDQYHCVYRGKIEAKGKGVLDMYFVEGLI